MIVTTAIDSFIKENEPGQNYGRSSKLWVNGGAGSDTRYAYIYFARPFDPGVTVLDATLRVYAGATWSGSQTLTAKRIQEKWKESRIKWNDKPGVSGTHSAGVSGASLSAGDVLELDVTEMLQDVSDGAAWYGFRLELSADANRALYSSDHPTAALRPQLEVDFSEAPQAPTSLVPGGGQAVSKTKPLLTWVFTDMNDAQASVQVQVSTSTDFSSPSYDSTKVAHTLSNFDLNAPPTGAGTFSALAADDVRYWRVKVWDEADLESEWSETQEFTRKTHGTLAITNPDEAPDNQVEETTPPIAWTFTGRTQTAWQVGLFRAESNGTYTELAVQSRVAGTQTEWNVPAGTLRTGDTYLAVVAVWDEIDRANMAGDDDYVVDARLFTYERSGTPAAVTALTATPDGAKVVLEFTRTTDPDYFAIVVDGVEVLDRVEVADVFVSGDDYAFDYWGAMPRVEHTYEVEAVVLDTGVLKHSESNATDTATTSPIGIWLADPLDSLGVFIAGKEKATMGIGKIAGVFDVIGERAPVFITDVIQGYEGNFNGVLLDSDARDDFLELYGRLTTLRLIIGDLNIPVELAEVSGPMPVPTGDAAGYDVGFAFSQVAEFDEAFIVSGN